MRLLEPEAHSLTKYKSKDLREAASQPASSSKHHERVGIVSFTIQVTKLSTLFLITFLCSNSRIDELFDDRGGVESSTNDTKQVNIR